MTYRQAIGLVVVAVLVVQFVVLPLALWGCGLWVARRRPERWWALLARVPLLLGGLNAGGGLVFFVSATRPSAVYDDMSGSLSIWLVFAGLVMLLHVACAGVFAFGFWRSLCRAPSEPGPGHS